ncbi:hypothetical protein Pfo_006866 [Paulownia fortunei]|nr:hypothetical protein Pfo_006866 [Paulownia fortunei]
MASTFVKSSRMKRMESKKSHYWWWDSHISPKNSKWLQENLQEMDQHVKRMLKLIEEDADSFAQKAEMYYQKRPELISLVEDFYRMYRSLAERYDHVTGELRKNIPSDLQSQGSGISDVGSEPPSTMPSPDRKPSRRKSGPRAAGFDIFLGSGGSGSDFYNKEGDESSKSESDDSSGTQSNDELPEVKEKPQVQEYKSLGDTDNLLSESKKSPSGWWDSHFTPKNSKLLQENLEATPLSNILGKVSYDWTFVAKFHLTLHIAHCTFLRNLNMPNKKMTSRSLISEMDQHIKRMLKLIEEDADSFAKKAEMYYQNRPELISLVEDFYRKYRSLAQRYDHVTGELRKNVLPSDRPKSGSSAAGYNFFLGGVGSGSHLYDKEGDGSSNLDSEDVRRVQIEQLKAEITHKNECVEELKKNLDALQLKYDVLMAEKDDLNINIAALAAEVSTKDDQIDEMSKHLHELHMEHVDLIAGAEGARKLTEVLCSRIQELEREVETEARNYS